MFKYLQKQSIKYNSKAKSLKFCLKVSKEKFTRLILNLSAILPSIPLYWQHHKERSVKKFSLRGKKVKYFFTVF